jgi:type 1 glutamine amidotransferase
MLLCARRYNPLLEGGSVRLLTLCALAAGCLAVPAAAQAPPKLQALIITGQHAGHNWRFTTPLLRQFLEDTGRFEVRVTEEFRGAGAETLAPYDVVVLNYDDARHPEQRWGERAETALSNFVRGGKGVVVYHFTLAAFEHWPEFEKLCAGNWRPGNGHHSARHNYTVTVRDHNHPIIRGMKDAFPQASDELYANLKWQAAGNFHVLATAWDDHSLYRPEEKQPVSGPGKDEPILWTVNYGGGRVFVTALGHDPDAMKSDGFISTLGRGTEWAATGNVTIPLAAELR